MIRNKQHLAALEAVRGRPLLETMYYADEVRKPERVDGSAKPRAEGRGRDGEVARREPERRRSSPKKYDDKYRKELLALIRAKAKGKELPEPQRKRRPRSST